MDSGAEARDRKGLTEQEAREQLRKVRSEPDHLAA